MIYIVTTGEESVTARVYTGHITQVGGGRPKGLGVLRSGQGAATSLPL